MSEINCKKTADLCKDFLEFESADELSLLLSRMMGTYIANAPVDKKDLANASYVVSRLTSLFYNLEKMVTLPDVTQNVLIVGEKEKCSPN